MPKLHHESDKRRKNILGRIEKKSKANTESKRTQQLKQTNTKSEEQTDREEGELRQTLRINFGHNPLRKFSDENQDVGTGAEWIQFHSTYLLSSLHLLNPGSMFFHTRPPPPHATDTLLRACSACFRHRNNSQRSQKFIYFAVQQNTAHFNWVHRTTMTTLLFDCR